MVINSNTLNNLIIWHAGTGQTAKKAHDSIAALNNPPKNTNVEIIDGIGSKENREKINELNGDSPDLNRGIKGKAFQTLDFVNGYTESHHLSSINQGASAIQKHIIEPNRQLLEKGKKPKKTNLIFGGFSRGTVAMAGLLASMSQEALYKGITRDNMFSRGEVNKLSFIPVDPVAGKNVYQDFMGLDMSKKNPLREIMAPISAQVPVDISLFTSRGEEFSELEYHDAWRQLIENPPEGVTITPEMTLGLGHSGVVRSEYDGLYSDNSPEALYTPKNPAAEKIEISPNGVLNAAILEKYGILEPKEVLEIYNQVHKIESKLIAMAIENKGSAAQEVRKQLGIKKYLDLPGSRSLGLLINKSKNIIKEIEQHKTNDKLLINGRDIDVKDVKKETHKLQLSSLTKASNLLNSRLNGTKKEISKPSSVKDLKSKKQNVKGPKI